MSRYPPEADEGQHRHYNDSFNPYSSPYESSYDPFLTPQSYNSQNSFISPPTPPPPPPPVDEYNIPQASSDPYGRPSHFSPPPPPLQPSVSNLLSPYHPGPGASPVSLQERYYDDQDNDHDTTDIPLLRRDPSTSLPMMPIPGSYHEEDTNIRYGRIPQRVPRRYKTIKRVEYGFLPCTHSIHNPT